ncbi:MAG TPA: PD-(D/E)XK nuclease family protein [bacterium]|nr:PD-(D/E)XK nuclease family protein [bacterium]
MANEIHLTPVQKEAVEHGSGPLLIVAGAGTGKTLVITHRLAWLVNKKLARPEEILAVTFTEKAAAEMTERVDCLLPYGFSNVSISTFHALGDRLLREFGLELGINPDFQVLSQAEQVLFFRNHLFDFPLRHYRPLGDPTRFIQAMLNVISRCKDEDISPETYKAHAERKRRKAEACPENTAAMEEAEKEEEVAAVYAAYQEAMAREGKLDFGDQVAMVLTLFRKHPSVLERVRNRYRFILVDEFQDTNFAQFQLVRMLAEKQANITVVGDDDQSIYKFRGAAISNILGFLDHYPGAKQVVMTDNYRSTQIILDTAYRLISHNNPDRLETRNQIDKRLEASREGEHPVEHWHCDTLTTESDRVAMTIRSMIDSGQYRPGDIAILVRTNQSADPFLRSLNMREVPWRFTGNRGLYTRPEIRLLVSFLRVLADSDDSLSLYSLASSEIYEMPMQDLHRCSNKAYREHSSLYRIFQRLDELDDLSMSSESRATVSKILHDIEDYLNRSRNQPAGVVLYQFLTTSGYLKRLTRSHSGFDSARVQNIARFFDVIWSYSQIASDDRVIHFVRHLDLLIEAGDDPAAAEADPDVDAVQVMTVHKAKGLEWPVVFMVSLINNRFPHSRRRELIELDAEMTQEILPTGDFHTQEERRLFYVGMTRAKDRLILTSAEDYGGVRKRKVSPFVLEALDRPRADAVQIRASAEEKIHRFAPLPETTDLAEEPLSRDVVLTLSHYQIDDYLTCPLKYKYVHILRVPILPHHSIVYGKALHAAVELYNRQKYNGIPVKLDQLIAIYKRAWKNVGFLSREHEERRFEAGKAALRSFFDKEEASGHAPARVEERFSFLVGNNRIAGRWDRVDERNGEVVIIDFKSSEVHRPEQAAKRVRESLQLMIYAMAYEQTMGKRPRWVELHFLESGLTGRSEVDDAMMNKAREKIEKAAEGIRKRSYTAAPSYQICRFCAYAEVCPAAKA